MLNTALTGWPEGAPDYSLQRCILVNSLVMHGYWDDQIAALLVLQELPCTPLDVVVCQGLNRR